MPRHWQWNHAKTAILIWLLSATIFYALFQMALRNSHSPSSSHSLIPNQERRSRLYDGMARDLDDHGAAFLKHGETSQSLSLADIFTLKDGSVTPVLKAAISPVRANVLYLSTEYSAPISEAVKRIINPYFDKSYLHVSWLAIWFQNSSLYHFSMFHASHHIMPIPATEHEIEAEAAAVGAVVKDLCPLHIVLGRVVLTSTGVLLVRWQYDAAILHTSFARLLGRPKDSSKEMHESDLIKFFHELVTRLNNERRGFRAAVSELWYAEEYDVLALALNGRMKVRKFPLGCPIN